MWKHIAGWVDITNPEGPEGPVDPGYGRPGGGGPVDPGYGRPDWGGHPDNSLPGGGYIWGAYAKLIKWLAGPHVDTKPPGVPILPVDPGWGIPTLPPHPWLPGNWVPVDPGFGKPPIWGFRPTDPGFGVGAPALPDNSLPGHWVPTDPDYGKPVGPCGPPHASTQPVWVWIAEIGPDFGKPKPTPPIAPGASPK